MTDPVAGQPDLRAAAAELIARLVTSGEAPGLEVGQAAPLFDLPDAGGTRVSLASRLADGPVVLSFYRGAWCPYCNLELRGLQAHLEEFRARRARLVAISPQRPDASADLVEALGLGFDVLSDIDQQVIAAYGLRFELTDQLKAIYPTLGMDLELLNGDGSWFLPVPATFVLDRTGVVRARHVDPNYTRRMDPADILHALDAAAAG